MWNCEVELKIIVLGLRRPCTVGHVTEWVKIILKNRLKPY